MENILEVSEVRQSFRLGFWLKKVEVLHGVSFQVRKNSIFGLLGPNGAGKTTLIQLIAGLRRPTSGAVKVGGFDAMEPAAKAQLGYLPERPYFHEHLTGEGLLLYSGTLSGLSKSEILARAPEVLRQVGMSHAAHTELRRYSKGMLQRIGIAQAILHGPELLILDEPMSGLDPLGRQEMRDLIVQLASQGRTVFFSSHVIPDVEAICHQVAMIRKGDLVGSGWIGDFLKKGPLQTEIAFKGLAKEKTGAFSKDFTEIHEIPDGLRVLVPSQDRATSVLKGLLAEGAQVLWVTPLRPSLEDLFKEGR